MKNRQLRQRISRILFCCGLVLLIGSAFLPLLRFDPDRLYDNLTEAVSPLTELFDEDLSEEMIRGILGVAGSQGGMEELDVINHITARDLYTANGEFAYMMRDSMETEEWSLFSGLLKGYGYNAQLLPWVLLLLAGVLLLRGKRTELGAGLAAGGLLLSLMNHVMLLAALRGLIETMISEAQQALDDLSSAAMSELFRGVLGVSWIPFLLAFGGIALCTGTTGLLLWDSGQIFRRLSTRPEVPEQSVQGSVRSGAVLDWVSGQFAGASVALKPNTPMVIGRDAGEAQLVLSDDAKISRRHCQIEYDGKQVYVTDFSSNGTRLGDGTRMARQVRTRVENGATVVLSPTNRFTVKY